MQQQHQCLDRRVRSRSKTRYDDFYSKLERIRLSAAAASTKQCTQRSATELLDESKAFFVKSEEVLRQRQSLINQSRTNEHKPVTSFFRIPQPRRSPYQDSSSNSDQIPFDLTLRSSTSPLTNSTTEYSDGGIFESVSLLSLSDQTTLDSVTSPSTIHRTVVPSTSLSVIERNARIIKWLFQLNKANSSTAFQTVQ